MVRFWSVCIVERTLEYQYEIHIFNKLWIYQAWYNATISAILVKVQQRSYTHCSYLDIYISQNIRLGKGDFEGKFQTILQPKGIIFLSENSDLLLSFSF